jgi:hypothetical protein
MREQRWERFEKLAAKIQEELAPGAAVVHNQKLPGKSGTDRQIDIVVRQKVGQFDRLIVMDCKDYKKPVDIGDIEQFIGMVGDVGAQKGAMISTSGFSKAAQRRATEAGIDLFALSMPRVRTGEPTSARPSYGTSRFSRELSFRLHLGGPFSRSLPSSKEYSFTMAMARRLEL